MQNILSYLTIAIFLSALLLTQPLYAAPDSTPGSSNYVINARLDDITQTLQSQKTDAGYWEYGWGAFDSGTMAWSAVQASEDNNRRDRATDIIQASESVIGLADVIFRPLPALSADSVCKEPLNTEEDRLQCLEAREALLEQSAERAREPYEILPHLGNFAFNLLAGLIVYRTADTHHALITAIPGEIIGEIQLETTPSQPIADVEGYKLQFGPLVVPTEHAKSPVTGMMVSFRF